MPVIRPADEVKTLPEEAEAGIGLRFHSASTMMLFILERCIHNKNSQEE